MKTWILERPGYSGDASSASFLWRYTASVLGGCKCELVPLRCSLVRYQPQNLGELWIAVGCCTTLYRSPNTIHRTHRAVQFWTEGDLAVGSHRFCWCEIELVKIHGPIPCSKFPAGQIGPTDTQGPSAGFSAAMKASLGIKWAWWLSYWIFFVSQLSQVLY